jgi:rifampin ADP-ribosylating transferase
MTFDPENNIVKLCAEGMASEGFGQMEKAKSLFEKAWNEAANDFEKFTAAHFVARHQQDVNGKLFWDETALEMALKINHDSIKPSYPSLYLNIAKCHEDVEAFTEAEIYYELAFSHLDFLPDDGYGNMIRSGVLAGKERIQKQLHHGSD